MQPHVYEFQIPFSAAQGVDADAGVIRGVSLITGGLKARGHDLVVDDTTVSQVFSAAQSRGQVPVKLDHKSGVENVCGYLTNFRVEGNKCLGDWHLLKTHPHYATTLEKAQRMPNCFGLSASFVGKEEVRGEQKFARCTELLSVDCVPQPAANPTGLFAAVDTQPTTMEPTNPTPPNPAPDTANVAELAARVSDLEQFCAAVRDFLTGADQLPEPGGEEETPSGEELGALVQGLTQLEAKVGALEAQNQTASEEHQKALAAKDKEITELKAKLDAKSEVTPPAPAAGASVAGAPTPPVAAAGKTQFETRVDALKAEGKTPTQAISLAIKEDPKRYAQHLQAKREQVVEMATS